MGTITHFTHQHPLKLQPTHSGGPECRLCDLYIEEDESYRCILGSSCSDYFSDRVYFQLHSCCAKFTKNINHPFHPEHPLVFVKDLRSRTHWSVCGACGEQPTWFEEFRYFCMNCDYALHLKCAALKPFVELPEQELHDVIHQHAVLECVKRTPYDHFRYLCGICQKRIEDDDSICVCRKCPSLMHKVCARLPIEIKHPFHLPHPLKCTYTGVFRMGKGDCDACGERIKMSANVYHCSVCCFTLDVHCAFLMPITQTLVLGEQEQERNSAQQLIGRHYHPHPLIECRGMKSFRRQCYGCDQPFDQGSSSIHVCLECSILLDTPCINSPLEIYHPLHPQHCLILRKGDLQGCYLCGNRKATYFYSCKDCNHFSLDIRCSTKEIVFVNSEIHEHNLVYIDFKINRLRCSICGQGCYNFVFRCLECDFCIHDHCHPSLPQTIKHECHLDSLTLTRSPIRDYPDPDIEEEEEAVVQEFYCFACEERRDLKDPTYYCAECHFVAHVHCVISKIIPYIQAQSTSLLENEWSKEKKGIYSDMTSQSNINEDESKKTCTNAAEDTGNANANHVVSQELGGDNALLQVELDESKKTCTNAAEDTGNANANHVVSQELGGDNALLQVELDELDAEISQLTLKIDELRHRRSHISSLLEKNLSKRIDNT